ASIRSTAMRLFAQRGFAAVTVREIAAAAGVSAPLVIHHYGSKQGLKEAVDRRVLGVVAAIFEMTKQVTDLTDPGLTVATSPFVQLLERDPDLTPYLRRLLVDGGPEAESLFRTLYDATLAAFAEMDEGGLVRLGPDPAAQAAFFLANDLGAVVLREQIRAVVGIDPLSGPGMVRWARTVLDVYTSPVMSRGEEQHD
ncbi:MAG: TetR/AcrR family transcriptional regulator, partial [Nocardioidaceae bacterium]